MRSSLFVLAILTYGLPAHGQQWHIHMGTGLSWARIVPQNSTPRDRYVRYGFIMSGLYLAPELYIDLNEHSMFGFDYRYSATKAGVTFHPNGRRGNTESAYDAFDLHNLSVGYYLHHTAFRDRLMIGAFIKGGLAYTYMTGNGNSGNGNINGVTQGTQVTATQTSDSILQPGTWIPNNTIGLTIATHHEERRRIDRLKLAASLTIGWKDMYRQPSTVSYSMLTGQGAQNNELHYRGQPLLLNIGISYTLFDIGDNRY